MSESKVYPVPAAIAAKAHVNQEQYQAMYKRSVDDPEGFWAEQAEENAYPRVGEATDVPAGEERRKYYVDGGIVEIAAHLVYELDAEGVCRRPPEHVSY